MRKLESKGYLRTRLSWKRNTCVECHRIVIFSNDEAAPGLRHAINEYNLLPWGTSRPYGKAVGEWKMM